MDNLIFSLNIVLPVFLVILLGSFLAKIRLLEPDVCGKMLKLVFYVSLPASLFQSIVKLDIREAMDPAFSLFAVGSTLFIFFLGWGISRLFLKKKNQIAASAHAAFRGNFVYVGLAVCQNLLGTDVVPSTVPVFTFVMPLYNILAVLLLSHYDEEGGKASLAGELVKILKNPMILAVAAAVPFSLLHIPIFPPVAKAIGYMAQTASPLALLLIGANLNLSSLRTEWRGVATATAVKIVLAPLLCTAAAIFLGFRGEELAVLFVLHAVPSAANTYIMTREMHADAELGAGAVVATALFSVITITAGIWCLRSMGFEGFLG